MSARNPNPLTGTPLAARFVVERLVREGALATVFRGRDLAGGAVCIKVVPSDAAQPGDSAARFRAERDALRRLVRDVALSGLAGGALRLCDAEGEQATAVLVRVVLMAVLGFCEWWVPCPGLAPAMGTTPRRRPRHRGCKPIGACG